MSIFRRCAGRCKSSAYLAKKTLAAVEQVEADRQAFRRRVARLDRRRFVFTDETGFHLAMTRGYGRAARGQRVVARVPRNTGLKLSLIGSLGLRGLVTSMSIAGSVDSLVFDAYVSRWLVPQLQPKDIVLLDNLPARHPERQARAGLTGADGLDAGPENLGNIGCEMDGKGEKRCPKRLEA